MFYDGSAYWETAFVRMHLLILRQCEHIKGEYGAYQSE